jgi:protein-S-isoprenylcysteine O-methyltransferase Ste14
MDFHTEYMSLTDKDLEHLKNRSKGLKTTSAIVLFVLLILFIFSVFLFKPTEPFAIISVVVIGIVLLFEFLISFATNSDIKDTINQSKKFVITSFLIDKAVERA